MRTAKIGPDLRLVNDERSKHIKRVRFPTKLN